MRQTIPLEYVEGVEEVTVWLWPDSVDPVTIRFGQDEWDEIVAKAEKGEYEDLEEMFGTVLLDELEEYP